MCVSRLEDVNIMDKLNKKKKNFGLTRFTRTTASTTTITTTTTTIEPPTVFQVYDGEEVVAIDVDGSSPDEGAEKMASPFSNENSVLLWTLTALYLANIIAIVVFNLITFRQLMVKRSKNVQVVTNPFVSCLLITNVLWPAINVPFSIVQIWTPWWHFGSITCKLFPVIQMCFPDAISLTLCLIAIERYISIIYPFKRNPLLKQKVAFVALAIVWLMPLSHAPFLAISHDQVEFDDENFVCTVTDDSPISAQFIRSYKVMQSAVILLVIPGILFPFCYGQIVFKVFAMKTSAHQKGGSVSSKLASSVHSSMSERHTPASINKAVVNATAKQRLFGATDRRRRNVTLLSIVVQVVHFACWTPIVVFQLAHFFRSYPTLTPYEFVCLRFFILLASTNPTLNSILYAAALYRDNASSRRTNSQFQQTQIRRKLSSFGGGRQEQSNLVPMASVDEDVFEATVAKSDASTMTPGSTLSLIPENALMIKQNGTVGSKNMFLVDEDAGHLAEIFENAPGDHYNMRQRFSSNQMLEPIDEGADSDGAGEEEDYDGGNGAVGRNKYFLGSRDDEQPQPLLHSRMSEEYDGVESFGPSYFPQSVLKPASFESPTTSGSENNYPVETISNNEESIYDNVSQKGGEEATYNSE